MAPTLKPRLRAFATGVLLCVIGAGVHAADRNAAELASFRAVAFGQVRSVSVARILDAKKHELSEPPKNLFHGFALLSNWQTADPESRLQIASILRTPILWWVKAYESAGGNEVPKLSSFCVPDPGYAIHLETDQGPRDFVVCLECDSLIAYSPDQHRAEFSLEDDPLAQLKRCYQKEFRD